MESSPFALPEPALPNKPTLATATALDKATAKQSTINKVCNALVAAIAGLDAKDAELEGKINSIIGDLASLEGATLSDINAKLSEHAAAIAQHTTDISGVKERVTAVEEAIKNLGEIEGGESLGEIVSEVKANTAALASLKGDAETVTAAVNKIAKDAADAAQAAAETTAAADATDKAAAAETAAKEYADGLVKDAEGNVLFDAAGSAAAAQTAAEATAAADATSKADAALAAAKEYADDLAGNYDAAGTAAGLDAAMDARVKVLEAIDHEQLVADAVAAVVAGAESDFDTLKEVAEWIAADTLGSAALQTTVSEHTESINTINGDIDALEAKVDEDIANLTTHMSEAATALAEVDGRLDALEAFEETHASIEISDIEGLFA